MSSNPNADAWIESYQILQGYQAPGTAREPLSQSLTSTNGAAYATMLAIQAGLPSVPWYRVVRHKDTQIDYAIAPGVFGSIVSPDHYYFMAFGGLITTPHGAAPVVETNWLEFVHDEASRVATNPRAVDSIIYPSQAQAMDAESGWGGFVPDEDTLRIVREWAVANGIASNASAE